MTVDDAIPGTVAQRATCGEICCRCGISGIQLAHYLTDEPDGVEVMLEHWEAEPKSRLTLTRAMT